MMDIRTIHEMSREAAAEAAEMEREPYYLDEIELQNLRDHFDGFPFPNLGSYEPEGWERVDVVDEGMIDDNWRGLGTSGMTEDEPKGFFVDSSGFGGAGEPALTVAEFLDALKPGYGYAVFEVGQFQVKVAAFRRL